MPTAYRGRFPAHSADCTPVRCWRPWPATWMPGITLANGWCASRTSTPPRCPAGSADAILRQLEAFGLHWDGAVRYQSDRHAAYDEALAKLQGYGYRLSL